MSTIEKLSIALPHEMVAALKQAVEAGEYSSSSEVVHDALRDWSHKRQLRQSGVAELRQVWLMARAGQEPGLPPEPVLERLERKYQTMADAAGAAD